MHQDDPAYFKSDIPTGRSGEWVLERVEMPERVSNDASQQVVHCFQYRPGTYTCLRRGPVHFMTDLYDEWHTQRRAIEQGCRRGGHILITGLGLGLVAEALFKAEESRVERITIVENSPDVIRLVAPHLLKRYGAKLEITEGDAYRWQPPPGAAYSVGWHDIWPDPHDPAAWQQMEILEERFRPFCAWQGCWPRDYKLAEREELFAGESRP